MKSDQQLAEFMDRFAIRVQIGLYVDLLNHCFEQVPKFQDPLPR